MPKIHPIKNLQTIRQMAKKTANTPKNVLPKELPLPPDELRAIGILQNTPLTNERT